MKIETILLPLLAAVLAAAGGPVARAQAAATALAKSTGSTTEALEEIIVTAQKQDENLQRTAAAVTVLSSDALQSAGVVDLRAAQKLVPSVRFQAEGASTEVYLRGVGSTLDLPNIEPPTTSRCRCGARSGPSHARRCTTPSAP